MDTNAFRVLGTPISRIRMDSFLRYVHSIVSNPDKGPGRYVVFRDVHGLVRALDDPELQRAHNRAAIVAPDGLPIAWLGRMRGHSEVSRVCGPDAMPAVIEFGLARGWKHYFFGGTPETLDALVRQLRERYKGLQVAGSISPAFGEAGELLASQYTDEIKASQPDIVWVGLGSPKQDIWMMKYAERVPGALFMGVGAAFDMHAGKVARAPIFLQKLGIEWAFRALQEPKRLGSRYARVVPRFFWALMREQLSRG